MTLAKKQQLALQGNWALVDIAGVAASHPGSLQINTDHHVSGNMGCNDFNGSIRPRGDHLNLSALAMTKKACQGAAMAQEQHFLTTLAQVKHFLVKGDALLLTDEKDLPVISLRAK
ncbi:MAG: META domain-containing protein [Pseudomonadales bacterium]